MSSVSEPDFCALYGQSGEASVKVELLVNGEVVAGRTFTFKHKKDFPSIATITGQTKILLNQGDIIQVRVSPQGGESASEPAQQYKAVGNSCSLTVERMRNFQ